MPLYEHTFLARHNLTSQQATSLSDRFVEVLTDNGGKVIDSEYWGLRSLAYRIRNNRKAHYSFMRIDAPADAVAEMERQMRLSEDVIRLLTVRVDEHEEGPSAVMLAKSSRESRRPRRRDGDGGPPSRREPRHGDGPPTRGEPHRGDGPPPRAEPAAARAEGGAG